MDDIISGYSVAIPIAVWKSSSNMHVDIDTEYYITQMGYNLGRLGIKPTSVTYFSRAFTKKGEKEGNYLVVIFDNKEDAFNFLMLYNTEQE